MRDSQSALKELGYNTGVVDGFWGKSTSKAVKKYQEDKNLVATGTLNEMTCNLLSEESSDKDFKKTNSNGHILAWTELNRCSYLRGRNLNNRLLVSSTATNSLDGDRMTLAEGESHGGPYDAMGIGTYVRIDDWGSKICGIQFRSGGFLITPDGFKLDPSTKYNVANSELESLVNVFISTNQGPDLLSTFETKLRGAGFNIVGTSTTLGEHVVGIKIYYVDGVKKEAAKIFKVIENETGRTPVRNRGNLNTEDIIIWLGK